MQFCLYSEYTAAVHHTLQLYIIMSMADVEFQEVIMLNFTLTSPEIVQFL